MDSLVQATCVFRYRNGVRYNKVCYVRNRETMTVKSVGIELPDGRVMKLIQKSESYKYLGTLEADRFLGKKMKREVSKRYFRRLKKVLKSELNGGNLVQGFNTWAVSFKIFGSIYHLEQV